MTPAARSLIASIVAVLTCAQTISADDRARVARADLNYDKPASRSEEGMPIGNGRTGTLLWTTPGAMHMQLNRVDVFADDSTTNSFPRAHSDYGSSCAYVDIRFGDETFIGPDFDQHLSCYDGMVTTKSRGVVVRALAWEKHDVIALAIEDSRPHPQPITIDLRMLRYAMQYVRGRNWDDLRATHESVVQTNAHTATSAIDIRDGRILLTQHFKEDAFHCASAAAAMVVGGNASAQYLNESTVRLTVPPGQGNFTVLLSTAATFDENADVGKLALSELDVTPPDFEQIKADHVARWHDFWSKSSIQLHSADGVADEVEAAYTYFLYIIGSSSRGGAYPPRFGGMLWYTNGDMRAWGSLYWWANQSCYFNGLLPSNHPELLDPTFNMYTAMLPACRLAARQQWDSQGIWIPETTFFNGPETLPHDIAKEMQDLYLLRKPWDQRSDRFQRFSDTKQSFSSRWNWIAQGGHFDQGHWINAVKQPPFGHVTHIFGTTAKIARLYWLRYEYTLDESWLRDRAYPILRGTVEFYRNFPNLKKESDGRYHLHHTNSNEPAWGVKDSDEDLAALRGTIPLLLRAAEILKVDADMRPIWQEFLDHLAALPVSTDTDALIPDGYNGPAVWVKGRRPAAKPGGLLPDGNTLPHWNFDLCTLENPDAETIKLANATFDAFTQRHGPLGPNSQAGTLSRIPIAGAQLGRADAVQYLLPNQINSGDASRALPMRNRLALREGPGATECERLGRAAEALHEALLQSVPSHPGDPPVIRLFPAWPKSWDASFTLAARDGFLVSSSIRNGAIDSVTILSTRGANCRLRNPWPGHPLILIRQSGPETLSGDPAIFSTNPGESVSIHPKRD